MAWEYSDKLKQLFLNALYSNEDSYFGELENPDAVGKHGSIACGDAIVFYLRIDKDPIDPFKDKIKEVKYKTFGCTSAIAASEALCSLISKDNPTPIEALKISNKDIVDFLGGMPEAKVHCSVMGAEVLKDAIADWAKKRKLNVKEILGDDWIEEEKEEGKIICECYDLSEPYLRRIITNNRLKTIEDIEFATKAGSGCGSCINMIGGVYDLVEEIWGIPNGGELLAETEPLDPELAGKIELLLDQAILPEIKKLGGSFNLVQIKEKYVYAQIEGKKREQIKVTVENLLKELIDPHITLIDI